MISTDFSKLIWCYRQYFSVNLKFWKTSLIFNSDMENLVDLRPTLGKRSSSSQVQVVFISGLKCKVVQVCSKKQNESGGSHKLLALFRLFLRDHLWQTATQPR